jgi:hypothetical protein
MILARQRAVRLLDVGLRGVFGNSQRFVIVVSHAVVAIFKGYRKIVEIRGLNDNAKCHSRPQTILGCIRGLHQDKRFRTWAVLRLRITTLRHASL